MVCGVRGENQKHLLRVVLSWKRRRRSDNANNSLTGDADNASWFADYRCHQATDRTPVRDEGP